MKLVACALGGLMLALPALGQCACAPWPAWEAFRRHFVNDSGRVIDPSQPPGITTSEGQAYGLFFALVAGDRERFERILRWTEDNLAGGDLTARLPAWQWGRRAGGDWSVIDSNAASDADLWLAYTLGEAGRLWQSGKYVALGRLLAERVLREETVDIAGFGRTLLPGPLGFRPAQGVYRLNPGYAPVQLMRRFAALYPGPRWRELVATSIATNLRSAPRGYAPDWVLYRTSAGFAPDTATKSVGGFDAIRVYLWAGTLHEDDPARGVLINNFRPMAQFVALGTPPLYVDTRDGRAEGSGPAGFSAALAPLLYALGMQEAAATQVDRVRAKAPLERSDNYYEQALVLFASGWMDGRFRYARDGALMLRSICVPD
jgi:endoglucanase